MPTSGDRAIEGYARAIVEVATAEGVLDRLEDELFTFARTVRGNTELRERLVDERVDLVTRFQIVEDLLEGKAHPQTAAAVNYVVQSGRARQLVDIAELVARKAAEARSQVVAEVRSAIELDADQRSRLAKALQEATGKQVSLKVIVDPEVVGGLVVAMGDEVIDGSVARSLAQLRAALTNA